jgi:hypothetical protein
VILGLDKKPIKIQKMLLMSSFQELHLYMIEHYTKVKVDNNKILFSEHTLRTFLPKHIKKAGDRYKQMCGCQTCVIFKDMYQCVKIWREKLISKQQVLIDSLPQSRANSEKRKDLDDYKLSVMKDNSIFPERAWNAAAELVCDKVVIHVNVGEVLTAKPFHKFGCVMGVCPDCPKWKDIIPLLETKCTDLI